MPELSDVEALVYEGKRLSLHMASASKSTLAGRIELHYDAPQIIFADPELFVEAAHFFAATTENARIADRSMEAGDFIEPGDYVIYEWDHTTRNGNTYTLTLTISLEPARVRL